MPRISAHAAPMEETAGQDIPQTMLALTFAGRTSIHLSTLPTPKIVHPTDVIVQVSIAGICGSDLHPFHEREKGIAKGCVTGHEFVGYVVAKGAQVDLQLGDRVMSPFTACCGTCFFCTSAVPCRCCHPQARLFGWVTEDELEMSAEERTGLQGAQAQYVRAPLADSTLVKVPTEVTDNEAILLGDILSTAFFCAEQGGVTLGSSVVVIGCGPVGLLTVMASLYLGAQSVWAVDKVPERLALAAQLGAIPVDFSACDVPSTIAAANGGRGVDVALEVVGAGAALRLAFDSLRPAGTLSSVGVQTDANFPWTPTEAYDKNLTYRTGRCPARHYMQKLLAVVADKTNERAQPWTSVITHTMPLSKGVRGYEMFDKKLDGCIKVVLDCQGEQ